jgi:formate dehydrogenase iron-sulfur subunit
VLTQLSVGAFCVGLILEQSFNRQLIGSLQTLHAVAALLFGLLALVASLFHLGRPQFAFRAVIGLRHSWLSREIVAFGAFAAFASIYACAVFVTQPDAVTSDADDALTNWVHSLGWCVAATGMIAVFCSTMIYVFTQRECWSFMRVGVRFGLTTALLGVAAVWLTILVSTLAAPSSVPFALIHQCGPVLCWAIVALTTIKLAWEVSIFRCLWLRKMTPLKRSAILMTGDLSNCTLARFAVGLLGGAILPMMLANEAASLAGTGLVQFIVLTGLLFVACLAGEILERYLFFAACAAPQMPGGVR